MPRQKPTARELHLLSHRRASGACSLRRFNALFKERYRLNPTGLRKTRAARVAQQPLVCDVAYRPPLDWSALLSFLGARAIAGVEQIQGNSYRRTAAFGKHS